MGRALRARINASPLRSAARGAAGPPRRSALLCLSLVSKFQLFSFQFFARRPSPAFSVSALRELCDKIRPPVFTPLAPLRGELSGSKKPTISQSSPRAKPSSQSKPPAERPAHLTDPSPVKKTYPIWSTGGRPRSNRGRNPLGDSFGSSPSSSVSALRGLCDKIRLRLQRLLRFFAANPPSAQSAKYSCP